MNAGNGISACGVYRPFRRKPDVGSNGFFIVRGCLFNPDNFSVKQEQSIFENPVCRFSNMLCFYLLKAPFDTPVLV